jgi:hypothetical protein
VFEVVDPACATIDFAPHATPSVLEVTPTTSCRRGLPLVRDMDGRPICGAYEPSLETRPIDDVDSCDGEEPLGSKKPIPSPLDPGIFQSPRDSGYSP